MPKSRLYKIFITLTLGVLFVYPVHSQFFSNIFKVTVILITLLLQEKLMYGVLLPLAFMLALRSGGWLYSRSCCAFSQIIDMLQQTSSSIWISFRSLLYWLHR